MANTADDVPLRDALVWLSEQLRPAEALLQALVDINSHTANPEGGGRVGALLCQALSDLPLDCRRHASTRFADHYAFATRAPGRPIALVGHLDTVFPPGTFEGYRQDGGLSRGPGVLDMKGGLVVCVLALRTLSRAGLLDRIPLRVIVVSDEEVGSPEGQSFILAEASQACAALVFEAGRPNDAIVMSRKGTGSMHATAKGRAAHAGNAHKDGINAVWALARFIDQAQALTDYARGITVSVGTFSGGEATNVVPARAEADLDLRFSTTADADALIAALRDAATRAAASVAGSSIHLSGGVSRAPMERTAASAALFEEYAACARLAGLAASEAPPVGGGSDASTLSVLGIPAIDGLGPRGTGYHTHDEQIETATLLPKAEALVRFLAGRLLGLTPSA